MSRFVEIALPLPMKELFTYKVPADSLYSDIVGKRVFVPFGKQYLTGVIVSTTEKQIEQEIKPIIEIIDEKQLFSSLMLDFTKWISEYYYCSWGEVLKAAMPPNYNLDYIKKINLIRKPNPIEMDELMMKAPKRAKLLSMIVQSENELTISYLQKELDIKNISPQLEALIQKGFISITGEWEKQIDVKVSAVKIKQEILADENKISEILNKLEKSAPKQAQIFSYVLSEQFEKRELIPVSEILTKYTTTNASLNALKDKGYLEFHKIHKQKIGGSEIDLSEDERNYQPTSEQQNVISEIIESVDSDSFSAHLLYGVTGSGKTLVYVKLIEEIIRKGKQALYLLPEISITPQIVDRMKNFFGEKIAVLHSRMTDNERNKIFSKIQQGEFPIVLGVRSAIFSPLNNLGLIIVDEEHDASYKQSSPAPRYNARDAAIVRARMENCTIVLGSATPSLETLHNVEKGNYKIHKLLKRVDEAKLPEIQVVDIREERKQKKLEQNFSSVLIDKITDKLEKNEGIILFHNRRGYAPQLYCPDCGNVPMCKNCDIALTYHKKAEKLVCHYCGYIIPSIKMCNICGSDDISEIGAGTEKIEEELKSILQNRGYSPKIARFDKDSTSKKDSSRRIMYGFINGDIDILVGTQMLTKGIDIGRVTLVGIINADQHLFFPDFRSNERTYQIITQVAGRAGRKSTASGEVIIQTSNPQAYAIDLAAKQDFSKFIQIETDIRRQINYPPFCRMVKIEILGVDFEEVNKAAYHFAGLFPKNIRGISLIGPVTPAISRIQSLFRQLIFIKSNKQTDKSNKLLVKVLDDVYQKYQKTYSSNSIKIIFDIDSFQNM